MTGTVKIDCDNCIEDIEIEIEGADLKEALNISKIRDSLKQEGWHNLKKCLCPQCKNDIGDKNCLNCKHSDYYDHNHRCKRKLSESRGIVNVVGAVVSEYDNCEYFEVE